MDRLVRWTMVSQNWFARWLTYRLKSTGPLAKVQASIDAAEFDAVVYGIDPVPEFERIYSEVTRGC